MLQGDGRPTAGNGGWRLPRSTGWTCNRTSNKTRCGHHNPPRTRKCGKCGKPRPAKRAPAHMAALKLTYEQYIELNGGEFCAFPGCGVGPTNGRRLDRDHDHATGKPRGLLCRKHNRMVKRWLTREFLEATLEYLKRTSEK